MHCYNTLNHIGYVVLPKFWCWWYDNVDGLVKYYSNSSIVYTLHKMPVQTNPVIMCMPSYHIVAVTYELSYVIHVCYLISDYWWQSCDLIQYELYKPVDLTSISLSLNGLEGSYFPICFGCEHLKPLFRTCVCISWYWSPITKQSLI